MTTHASFWEAIRERRTRCAAASCGAFLTLLGIILATTTLIAVMSVISGMDVYIAQNVSNMGADGYRVTRIVMMQWDPKKYPRDAAAQSATESRGIRFPARRASP